MGFVGVNLDCDIHVGECLKYHHVFVLKINLYIIYTYI